jgi:hypothetical protein
MTLNIPKLSFSREETLSPRALISIVLLSVICIRAHEYSHIASLVIQGRGFTSGFGWVSPYGDDNRIVSTIAGPMLNYVVMWMGLILLLRSHNRERSGFELIFATLPFFRLFGYMFSTIPGRDEIGICRAVHIADPIAAAIVGAIVVPPVVFAYFSIGSRPRVLWFLFFFVALPMLSSLVVTSLGDQSILLLVKSNRFKGTPISSMFHGIPAVVLWFDAALISSFLLVSSQLRRSTDSITKVTAFSRGYYGS